MQMALLPMLGAMLGMPQQVADPSTNPVDTGATATVPDDIQVTGSAFAPSKLKQGGGILETLFPHAFQVGSTGGNLLGSLKDAFLIQAGQHPQYAPKLQQAREAEALQDFSSDPLRALQQYQMIDPEGGLKALQTYQENQRQDALASSRQRNADLDYDNAVRSRIGSMLYAANEKTYPQMLARAQAYAKAKGIDVDLPQSFDEAKAWALGDVPVDKQVSAADMRDYRDASLAQRASQAADRNNYYNQSIAERARHDRASEASAAANAEAHRTSAGASALRAQKYQPGRGRGSVAPGTAKKFHWDASQGKYVAG